jgi:hypothetical protein
MRDAKNFAAVSEAPDFDRDVTLDPALQSGVKSIRPDHGGHDIDEVTLPRNLAL